MALWQRASRVPGSLLQAVNGLCPGAFLSRLFLLGFCAAGFVASVAAIPFYPCLILADDSLAGREDAGYHETTTGNSGGACRNDDVDLRGGEDGFFVMDNTPGEWLGCDFSVDSADTEHSSPVLLRGT